MVFFSQPHRAPKVFWLLPDGASESLAARLMQGGAGIALPEGARALQEVAYAHVDRASGVLRCPDGRVTPLLCAALPSQAAEMSGDHAVMLDIVLADSTEGAWAEMERLIGAGLPASVAASALIGTAREIAQRMAQYRDAGARQIVLSAPSERAPYDAVARDVLPLLRRSAAPDRALAPTPVCAFGLTQPISLPT